MAIYQKQSHAKINLSLDVLGKRADGYHTVSMVMQQIGLFDTVTLETGVAQTTLTSNVSSIPLGAENLALRACLRFFEYTGIQPEPVHIHIEKQIPVAAGLAGGSGNAGAVLELLNQHYAYPLSDAKLLELGLSLGADVPFCIKGGTALAEGIGERLTSLPAVPNAHLVLCKPPIAVSTAWVYAQMDGHVIQKRPDTQGLVQAILAQSLDGICKRMYNVMEEVVTKAHPVLADIRTQLTQYGAEGVLMSGSGPTMFGVFTHLATAQKAYEALKPQFAETFLTTLSAEDTHANR